MDRAELAKFKTELEAELKATEKRVALLNRKIAAVGVLLEEEEPAEPAEEITTAAEPAQPPQTDHQPVAFFDVVRQVRKLKG